MDAAWPPPAALAAWLRAYGLEPAAPAPLPLGAHTYRVFAQEGSRLLRGTPASDDPQDLALLDAAHSAGLPCPLPLRTLAGDRRHPLEGIPAALYPDPAGLPVTRLEPAQAAALGTVLGRLHVAGLAPQRPRPGGARALKQAAQAVAARLPAPARELVERELFFQSLFRLHDVPRGLVHGAPWGERVLFEGARLSALLGFESAGEEALLFDVAAAALHGCWDGEGLDEPATRALLTGYRAQRPTEPIERGAWTVLLRAAALSAWLAALDADGTDPAAARVRLEALIADEARVRRLWE